MMLPITIMHYALRITHYALIMATTTIIPKDMAVVRNLDITFLDKWARNTLLTQLRNITHGQLLVKDGDEEYRFGHEHGDAMLTATITVHHPGCYSSILFGGTIGAGRAYMEGLWTADTLTDVIRIFFVNQDVLSGMDQRWTAFLTKPLYALAHSLHKNTKERSQSNIMAHYDLGNNFYQLFLDETMTYSAGIFETPESTIKEASLAKYDRICRKLKLNQEDHVLEIGTGWGGFAMYAVKHYDCRVTTTTISREQYAFATQRIEQAGLAGRINLLLDDYRDLTGTYDKLVSIEMIEAVGHQYYETFFRTCGNLLKESGMMLIQTITVPDHEFDRYIRSVDFIRHYIFPGGCLPSVTALLQAMSHASDLRLCHLEDITPHYTATLRHWRKRFFKNIDRIRQLGYSDTFIRMWDFYLSSCEAGFAERHLGDVHLMFTKPRCRCEPILPELSYT